MFNKDGLRVDTGETVLRDATSLAVGLEPLDPGTYTVTWQATIVSDAHRTTGSFRFTVTGGAAAQALTDTTPTVTNTLTRWGELLGMALVAGTIGTLVTVWRPVFPSVSRETRVQVGRRFRLLAFAGLAVVAVALVVDLLDAANAGTSGGTGIGEALSDTLVRSQTGLLFLLRVSLVVAIALLWSRLIRPDVRAERWALYLVAGLSGLLLLGRSLGSHAAASDDSLLALSVASDFIHLTAACLWVGGLVALVAGLAVIRQVDGEVTGRVVARFSSVAILAVGAVAITGLYNAWLEVASLQALPGTAYGRVLLIKTGVLAVVLGIASINLIGRLQLPRYLSSRAAHAFNGLARKRLGLLVRAEVLLVLVVLAMTALLAHLPLARDAIAHNKSANEAPMGLWRCWRMPA